MALPDRNKTPELDPLTVSLDLTYRCGLRCGFCFVSRNTVDRESPGKATLARASRLVEKLSERKRCFYLAGGEPSIFPWLPDLVRLIKARGHRCLLTTNAQGLTRTSALALAAAGLDDIEISLHGPPDLHDKIVGKSGAFAKAGEVCRELLSLPVHKRPAVSLWCTINRANHSRLYDTYLALKAVGPEIIAFNHLTFVTKRALARARALFKKELGAELGLKDTSHLARGIDPATVAGQIKKIRACGDPAVRFDPDLSDRELRAWYDAEGEVRPRGFCVAQWSNMWVRPEGAVVPCQPLNYRLGDAYSGDPLAVYNGKPYTRLRKLLLEEGGFLPTCGRCGRSSFSSSSFKDGPGWLLTKKRGR